MGQMAILARHWNILPALGLPSAPAKEQLLRVLAVPSIATIEEEGEEEGGEDAEPEEYYSSSEGETDEEEVEEEERGPNKRSRR
jgi:hypothetical protein